MPRARVLLCLVCLAGFALPGSLAAQVPTGPELPVSLQPNPGGGGLAVAVDDRGRSVVAWYGDAGVRARLFEADGTPASGEIQVNQSPVADAFERNGLAVAMASGRGFVVVWAGGETVRARRFNQLGTPRAAEFVVGTTPGSQPGDPGVAFQPDGGFVIAWTTSITRDNSRVVFRRFATNGQARGGEVLVADNRRDDTDIDIASDGGGNFVIVWTSFLGEGELLEVFARLYGPNGRPRTAPIRVDGGGEGLDTSQFGPAVAMAHDGRFVVVWVDLAADVDAPGSAGDIDAMGIIGQRFAADGSFAGPQFRPHEPQLLGAQGSADVAMTAGGDFFVTWPSAVGSSSEGVAGGFGRRFGADGTPLGEPIRITDQPTAPVVALTPGGDGLVVWDAGSGVRARRLAGGCADDDPTLCIGGRFRILVAWTAFDGSRGVGHPVRLTDDTGYFWFFDAGNAELIVKILDGRGTNGHWWVFFGALTNVQYTLWVTDTTTGLTRAYFNPSGQFASRGDTDAFPEPPDPGSATAAAILGQPGVVTAPASGPCVAGETRLCLADGRFALEVTWTDFQGGSGPGHARTLLGDSGYFWFFDDDNVELVVKVLDGRAINDRFWLFYGSLTNVGFELKVTDLVSGRTETYINPSGVFASAADLEAFAP